MDQAGYRKFMYIIERTGGKMTKTYRKDGNKNTKGKTYCKEHFIELYGREPNILDTAHLTRPCWSINHCERRNGENYQICNGKLKLTDSYRQDKKSVEEWTCEVCGNTIHRG